MILEEIVKARKKRVNTQKERLPINKLLELLYENGRYRSLNNRKEFQFEKALIKQDITFICEVKKASPSKGIIAKDFPYQTIALDYVKAGADAISVLTEPDYFMGSNEYLSNISNLVHIPVLRKDFTIDEYQIYEAKYIGADAVLLICALLDTQTIKNYLSICDQLGLSAIVEAHTEEEVNMAMKAGARIIGVNNRNLRTFEVDINLCTKLRERVPKDIIFVAESGISSAEDIKRLREADVNAVLIGETLMRSDSKVEALKQLRGYEI